MTIFSYADRQWAAVQTINKSLYGMQPQNFYNSNTYQTTMSTYYPSLFSKQAQGETIIPKSSEQSIFDSSSIKDVQLKPTPAPTTAPVPSPTSTPAPIVEPTITAQDIKPMPNSTRTGQDVNQKKSLAKEEDISSLPPGIQKIVKNDGQTTPGFKKNGGELPPGIEKKVKKDVKIPPGLAKKSEPQKEQVKGTTNLFTNNNNPGKGILSDLGIL